MSVNFEEDFENLHISTEPIDGADSARRATAVDLFNRAGQLEGAGDLSQALPLYVQAYRLEPLVDRISATGQKEELSSSKNEQLISFCPVVAEAELETAQLYHSDPRNLRSSLLGGISDDLLERIFLWTGISNLPSMEVLAQTCRRCFLVSRSNRVWRILQLAAQARPKRSPIYASPIHQRIQFFKYPIIRTDGIYICKVTYYRQGLPDPSATTSSAIATSHPVHLVVYYRYLRFFGILDGFLVYSLTSSDPPATVIERLRDAKQVEGLSVPYGEWQQPQTYPRPARSGRRMRRETAAVEAIVQENANLYIGRYFRDHPKKIDLVTLVLHQQDTLSIPENNIRKRPIRVTMKIQVCPAASKHPFRRNALRCESYSITHPPTQHNPLEDIYEIDVTGWNKFYFSRVRSYNHT